MIREFEKDGLVVSLAQDDADVRLTQRLRYDVFVTELGGQGAGVDHDARLEGDEFDAIADHLMIRDRTSGDVVGSYRLLRSDAARQVGGFYSDSEFDLTKLTGSGRNLLELGRSCIRSDYRSGSALLHLWNGLSRYVKVHGSEILFGVASFSGTEPAPLLAPLSLLHQRYLAPVALRPQSRQTNFFDMSHADCADPKAAMVQVPPLLKGYLRLGARIGQGAFVDRAFHCTDVCVVMEATAMSERLSQPFKRAAAG